MGWSELWQVEEQRQRRKSAEKNGHKLLQRTSLYCLICRFKEDDCASCSEEMQTYINAERTAETRSVQREAGSLWTSPGKRIQGWRRTACRDRRCKRAAAHSCCAPTCKTAAARQVPAARPSLRGTSTCRKSQDVHVDQKV